VVYSAHECELEYHQSFVKHLVDQELAVILNLELLLGVVEFEH